MDTSTSTHSLAELPPEILYMIFDFLDMHTLKSVSETCHPLNDIFSNYYCGRFMLNIRLDKVSSRESPYNAEYAVKRILQSKRCYRKVHLPVHDGWFDPNHHMYSIMYRVLLGDWSNQLVVLILEMDETTELCGATITTALHHMDHLKELRFLHTHEWNYPIQIFLSNLVVENHTLELLELEVVVPAMIHCRKLRQLIVSPHLDAETQFGKQYAQHGEAEPFWKLKHLEEFTLKRAFGERPNLTEHRPGYRCKLYEHLTKLTKLHFHASGVSEKFLQSICKSCVLLEDLFIFSLQTVDSNVLARCLSNLTHLRRLGIWRITTRHPISFASINAPKLEQLTLGRVDVVWESVEQLRSLKSLSIIPYFHNALRIPESFAKHVKQIECLWLDLCWLDHAQPTDVLRLLPELPRLSTLILERMHNDTWRCPDPFSSLPPLKLLVLHNCTNYSKRFPPNIKRIELKVPKHLACDFRESLRADDLELR